MSKQYELTKKIHQELERLGVETKGQCYFVGFGNNAKERIAFLNTEPFFGNKYNISTMLGRGGYDIDTYLARYAILAIQEPQIRQILIAVADRLGGRPEYKQIEDLIYEGLTFREKGYKDLKKNEKKAEKLTKKYVSKTQVKDLDDRWLGAREVDGKYTLPLFQTNPEQVLEELLQTLENLT